MFDIITILGGDPLEKLGGLLQFASPLIVRGDALGKKYLTRIGEHDVILYFPELPDKPLEGSFSELELLPATDCKLHSHDSWGRLKGYNSVEYKADSCCADVFQVYIECESSNSDGASADIFASLDEWRTLLEKNIYLEMKCVTNNLMPSTHLRNGIELFCITPVAKKYDPCSSTTIAAIIFEAETALTQEALVRLFEQVRCGLKVKLEYELLIQAYEERSKGNYRYSLVQALSAVEVCVGNRITMVCTEKNIDAKRLIGKKSLGDKFEIVRALGIDWPTSNPNEEITKYRNDLFHMRLLSLTVQELNQIISKIEIYLRAYSPTYFE